ncbi:hypothetical protein BDZ45DRAFT_742014 [Acephala macrosclerotiorum]|nr:hypothetical protein BDZ45DRAFT_742014 [Acephala macrosclerotiorum]
MAISGQIPIPEKGNVHDQVTSIDEGYLKRIDTSQAPTLPDPGFRQLEASFTEWNDHLPPTDRLTSSSIYTRKDSGQLGALFLMHFAYHISLCDLYQLSMPMLCPDFSKTGQQPVDHNTPASESPENVLNPLSIYALTRQYIEEKEQNRAISHLSSRSPMPLSVATPAPAIGHKKRLSPTKQPATAHSLTSVTNNTFLYLEHSDYYKYPEHIIHLQHAFDLDATIHAASY